MPHDAPRPPFARTQPHALRKIGYWHPRTIDPAAPSLSYLRPVWERLGYAEPETVLLRAADGYPARLPTLTSELIGLGAGGLIAVSRRPSRRGAP